MKKWITIALCLVMVLSLAACGGNGSSNKQRYYVLYTPFVQSFKDIDCRSKDKSKEEAP